MTRLAFNRILLSLLLLFSQQMALSHALTHVTATFSALNAHGAAGYAADLADGDSVNDNELSNAIAQDKSCHQCLAFAQLFGPLANTPRAFAPPDLRDIVPVIALADARVLRTVCVFRSRAPPQV